jgi:hypothetical protein
MAEVLALVGGGAAATQLLHYAIALLSGTSALSHRIRHTSDRIELWVNESSSMLVMLDSILSGVNGIDAATLHMIERCRSDVVEIRVLLRPFRSRSHVRRASRRQEFLFVLLREDEIERRLVAVRNAFQTMSLGLLT